MFWKKLSVAGFQTVPRILKKTEHSKLKKVS